MPHPAQPAVTPRFLYERSITFAILRASQSSSPTPNSRIPTCFLLYMPFRGGVEYYALLRHLTMTTQHTNEHAFGSQFLESADGSSSSQIFGVQNRFCLTCRFPRRKI